MGRIKQLAFAFACLAAGSLSMPAGVFGEESAGGGASTGSLSLTDGSLVVSGVEMLTGAESQWAGEEAWLTSPEAVEQREASASAYAGLGGEAAQRLVSERFPGLTEAPDGGPPRLPEGGHVTGFPSDNAMAVDLGDGRHAVVESLTPMAVDTPVGRQAVNLGLREVANAFEAERSPVAVSLPKDLGEGVTLEQVGISLSPLDAAGGAAATSSPGNADGYSVFWGGASMGSDVDLLGRPTATGLDLLAMLRSARSPEVLRFRVGMPAGASLAQDAGSSVVRVVDAGQTIAAIAAPMASDAQGTNVPVRITAEGDVVSLTIEHPAGRYAFPLIVDPTVEDTQLGKYPTNWRYVKDPEEVGDHFTAVDGESSGWSMYNDNTKAEKDWGELLYPTQGESEIYKFTSTTSASDAEAGVTNYLVIQDAAGWQVSKAMPASYASTPEELCLPGCAPESTGKWGNEAADLQYASSSGTYGSNTATAATVYIYQPSGPTVSFDTADATINGARNVLYAGGTWLGAHEGVFKTKAHDPGIGVNEMRYSSPNSTEWKGTEEPWQECAGLQCEPEMSPILGYTFQGHHLPDGEDTVEVVAYDGLNLSKAATTKVKVDGTPPRSVVLAGLPSSHEIGERAYQLKAEATDGLAPTPSSGIASIALKMDGVEVGKSSGSCSPGPCTASSGEWTIRGTEYAVGQHTLSVIATDKAGNSTTEAITVTVHHPSAIAVGPAAVDPVTGEATLISTDVAMSAAEANLSVSRSYNSEHVTAGATGPLGGQWIMSLSGQSSLVENAEHAMVLTSASGSQTIFTSIGAGKYRSPAGNGNLTLTEKQVGGKKAFVLSNSSTASSTTFALPAENTRSCGGVLLANLDAGLSCVDVQLRHRHDRDRGRSQRMGRLQRASDARLFHRVGPDQIGNDHHCGGAVLIR